MTKNIVTLHPETIIRHGNRVAMAETIQHAITVVNDEDSQELTIEIMEPTTVSKSYEDVKMCATITTVQR